MAARKTFNTPRTVRDPDGTLVNVLSEQDISTVNRPGTVIELDPIDIEGSRSRAATLPSFDAGRDETGRSRMVPDWVPQFVLDAAGQPVEDERTGVTGYEVPEWAAEFVADDEGNMPTSARGIVGTLAGSALTGGMLPLSRRFTGVEPSAEQRTFNPLAATAGAAETAAVPLTAIARLAGHRNAAGLFSRFGGDEDAWESEMRYAQRANPGSFAVGEGVGMVPSLLIPGVQARQGAGVLARAALGAGEGALWGGMEGLARSNEDTLGGQLTDALPGAIGGGVLGGALAGASARLQRSADAPEGDIEGLRTRADLQWASQAGAAGSAKRQREMAGGTDAVERVENMRQMVGRLRELGALEPRGRFRPPTEDSIAAVVTRENEAAQRTIFETLNRMDEAGTPDIQGLLGTIDQQIARLDRIPGAESATAAMRAQRAAFEAQSQRPDFSFQDLQAWKNRWRRSTNFTSDSPLQADRQTVYGAIRDNMQDNVASVDPELAARYRDARGTRRMGMHFDEMRADDMLNEARNRNESLTDIIAGTAAGPALGALAHAANAGTGGSALLGAAGLYAGYRANKFIRQNSHGWRAMSLERAANALETNPERFGRWAQRLEAARQRGQRAFAAALYTAAQSDEAVRAQLAEQDEREGMRQAATADAPVFTSDNDADFFAPDVPVFDSEDDADFFRMEDGL